MSRVLAHVERVEEIKQLFLKETMEPAGNIELSRVLGWWVVTKKGEYKVGSVALYIEIDSKVNLEIPALQFLEPRKGKVKTMKLNKFVTADGTVCVSQGLLIDLQELPDNIKSQKHNIGDDLTDALKIVKIEDETIESRPPRKVDRSAAFYQRHYKFFMTRLGKFLKKSRWFKYLVRTLLVKTVHQKKWPLYIVKTDETRIQNVPSYLTTYAKIPMQATEKLDGTSSSYGLQKVGKNFEFAVCSRNVRQLDRKQMTWYKDAEVNFYWEMTDKYDIEAFLNYVFKTYAAKDHVYLQGEIIGPSIQGNKYKLSERELRAFNLVIDGRKVDSVLSSTILKEYAILFNLLYKPHIKWVPILETEFMLPKTVDEMVKYATSKSQLYDTLREGVVVRDANNTVSFKTISPEFQLKHNL